MKNFLLAFVCILFIINVKAQTISTIAGNGTAGYNGDNVIGTSASLNQSYQITTDKNGNVYIADYANHRVRKVGLNGIITTVAGNGAGGYTGDGGPATQAELYYPEGVAVDTAGNLYIADNGNSVIRKVTPGGTISTIAGTHNGGLTGDGGPATAAELDNPGGLCLDAAGNLYIADIHNNCIRKINTAGIISTVAGNGNNGYSGDGGAATAAELNAPNGVAVDAAGNIYIADINNNRVRKVDKNGIITTVAGTGATTYNGDGILAVNATVGGPGGVVVDASGNLLIAEFDNNRIRKVNSAGVISTIAGTGTAGFGGDGGAATAALLDNPLQIALDLPGNIYVSDRENNRIRKILIAKPSITSFSPTSAGTGYSVTITGKNLGGATAVSFGGVAAKSFVVDSTTKIVAVVGAGATGSVSVTTPGGTATLAGFNYCYTPSISIAASASSAVCSGTPVKFMATATYGGATPVYQWKKNGATVGGDSSTYTDNTLKTGDTVFCILTSNATPCVTASTVSSNKVGVAITPLVTPTISISASAGSEVCTGVKVSLAATITNGGTAPVIQWFKNNVSSGGTSLYIDTVPKTGDSIFAVLTSNAVCATIGKVTSNVVGVKVDVPTPIITISTAKDTICSSTSVTFTATVNPFFQWKKDGIIVGNNSSTYTDNSLKNGDIVQAFLVSSASACNSSPSNIINSNQIKFTVNSAPAIPSAISGPVNVAKGQKGVYFSVTAVAGVGYVWSLPNGSKIDSGQGGNKIKVDWDSTGGSVSVMAYNSCGASPARTLTVGVVGSALKLGVASGVGINDFSDEAVKLYPNPAGASATLQFTSKTAGKYAITILDANSNVMEVKSGISVKGTNTVKINTAAYAKGMYFITIIDKENGQRAVKLVKGE